MKHPRDQAEEVSLALALSLSTDSAAAGSSSDHSAGSPPAAKRARRRGPVVATSGEGDFVCKTCSRAFTSFQALGGHRTSHLRGRHGLELGVGAKALRQHKAAAAAAADGKQQQQQTQTHECHICGLGFEMGQALGGHMRRHREEMGAADAWVWRPEELRLDLDDVGRRDPPVLLELFA